MRINFRTVSVDGMGLGIIAARRENKETGAVTAVFVLFDADTLNEDKAGWFSPDVCTIG